MKLNNFKLQRLTNIDDKVNLQINESGNEP